MRFAICLVFASLMLTLVNCGSSSQESIAVEAEPLQVNWSPLPIPIIINRSWGDTHTLRVSGLEDIDQTELVVEIFKVDVSIPRDEWEFFAVESDNQKIDDEIVVTYGITRDDFQTEGKYIVRIRAIDPKGNEEFVFFGYPENPELLRLHIHPPVTRLQVLGRGAQDQPAGSPQSLSFRFLELTRGGREYNEYTLDRLEKCVLSFIPPGEVEIDHGLSLEFTAEDLHRIREEQIGVGLIRNVDPFFATFRLPDPGVWAIVISATFGLR